MLKNSVILSFLGGYIKKFIKSFSQSYFLSIFKNIGKWFNKKVNESYIYNGLINETRRNNKPSTIGKHLYNCLDYLLKGFHQLWINSKDTSILVNWTQNMMSYIEKDLIGALRSFFIGFMLSYVGLKLITVGFYMRLLLIMGIGMLGLLITYYLDDKKIYKDSKVYQGLMEIKKCIIWSDLHE